jgi:hypothetical protein
MLIFVFIKHKSFSNEFSVMFLDAVESVSSSLQHKDLLFIPEPYLSFKVFAVYRTVYKRYIQE